MIYNDVENTVIVVNPDNISLLKSKKINLNRQNGTKSYNKYLCWNKFSTLHEFSLLFSNCKELTKVNNRRWCGW